MHRQRLAKIPKLVPVTSLCRDTAGVLKELQGSDQPIVLTRRGRAAAILMRIDAYERSEREKELLRMLVMGEKEIALGRGCSMESVLQELDSLLLVDGP